MSGIWKSIRLQAPEDILEFLIAAPSPCYRPDLYVGKVSLTRLGLLLERMGVTKHFEAAS